jgi:CTP synthase
MPFKQVLILGDFDAGLDAHAALRDAVAEASERAGQVVNTRWLAADDLALRPGAAADAHGIMVAPRHPGGHREFPEPVVSALKIARERKTPLLATGDGHELVLIEVARHVLGMEGAGSTFYDEEAKDPIIKELSQPLRPMTNRRPRLMDVDVRHDATIAPYLPAGRREEAARLTHGLNPDYGYALEEAGLRVAAVDAVGGRPCLWALDGSPWHVAASFLPQLGGRPDHPHGLIEGFIAHVVAASTL